MFHKDRDSRSRMVTVRLNEKENRDLEELAIFFGVTKSDVLADGMRMVRDLKQVIAELLHDDPDLAHVLRDSLIPGILNTNFRREKLGEVGERVLIGLIRKDFVGAGRRASLVLKLFQE